MNAAVGLLFTVCLSVQIQFEVEKGKTPEKYIKWHHLVQKTDNDAFKHKNTQDIVDRLASHQNISKTVQRDLFVNSCKYCIRLTKTNIAKLFQNYFGVIPVYFTASLDTRIHKHYN